MCYFARDYPCAEAELRQCVVSNANYAWGHNGLGSVYLQTGRFREAVAELERGFLLSHRGVMELTYVAHAHAASGDRARAMELLDEMKSLSRYRFVPPEYVAVVYTGLGDIELAIEWMAKAYAQRSMHAWMLPDPRLDPLRTEARFQQIRKRMGLR
jgi:tetratricopeptide (TPR) repeat protein